MPSWELLKNGNGKVSSGIKNGWPIMSVIFKQKFISRNVKPLLKLKKIQIIVSQKICPGHGRILQEITNR